MIKIFSKKNLGFRNQETNEIITIQALSFKEVPDWCEKDPGFGWAVRDGAIQVIEDVSTPAVDVPGTDTAKTVDEIVAEEVALAAEEAPSTKKLTAAEKRAAAKVSKETAEV